MSSRVLPLASALVALLVAACGGGHDATEKQLADVRSELVKLRADNAAMGERLDSLEIARGALTRGAGNANGNGNANANGNGHGPGGADKTAPAPSDATATRPPDGDKPALDVVRLSPDAEPVDDPNSNAPRPVLRLNGDGGQGAKSTAKKPPAKPGPTNPKKKP